jgi:hypothetical protein
MTRRPCPGGPELDLDEIEEVRSADTAWSLGRELGVHRRGQRGNSPTGRGSQASSAAAWFVSGRKAGNPAPPSHKYSRAEAKE